ncbi:YybH family protein [Rhodococcus sp. UNC23MFCrub1.1]|uniref:YybH family protein n=1 Tax=Rhodococcus sp. UNC23MFCrub1.1 TaxID=1449068 RepID=UPI00048756CB|nr:SgcJ/EcaC family oxidoreductase [Rhodococcus sp. UNC23MFCrub1.1]
MRIYSQYLNAGDVEGLMSMYDDDATFSPEFGTVARGTDEIRAVVTAMVDPPPSVKSNVTWVQQVGDHALVLNDYAITVVGPDGTSAETTGRSADVAHRGSDGGWRFFIDCVWAGS